MREAQYIADVPFILVKKDGDHLLLFYGKGRKDYREVRECISKLGFKVSRTIRNDNYVKLWVLKEEDGKESAVAIMWLQGRTALVKLLSDEAKVISSCLW